MPLNPKSQHSGARIFDSDGDPLDNVALVSNPKDFAGRKAFNTVFGEQVVGWHVDSVSVQFQYNLSPLDVTSTVSGGGAVVHANHKAKATIGTGVGSCAIASKDSVRYRPGHEVTAQFTTVYTGAQVGVNQYHGILNGADGFAFGTKDGVLGVWFIADGVETFTPRSQWLGDKLDGTGDSGLTLDITKMAIYQVQYGWLGTAPAVFSVYAGHTLGWVVCHWLDFTNQLSIPHLSNPTLPIQFKVVRASGTGTAATVETSSCRAGVTAGEDENNASNRWFSHTLLESTLAGVAGTRYNVMSIVNPATFLGLPNHVVLEIGTLTFDNSANKTLAFYGSKGSTITGGAAPVAVDAVSSVASIITGGTVTLGTLGHSTVVRKDTALGMNTLNTGARVYPGETLTIEALAASAFTGTISLSTRWVEYF